MTNETTDNVTWICPDCRTVTVDPADVTALQAAHDALKDENKRLTELLRGDRMVVATRINHEYTKAKGVIRELQAENERLRALLENTRQQRDDAYNERAEAQRWQPVAGEQTFPLRYGELIVEDNGAYIAIDGGEALGEMHAWLPENVRMCRKVQP
jgi:hypothetical protein